MSIPNWAKRFYYMAQEQFLRIPEMPRSFLISALFLCGAYLTSGILINHTGGENNSALVFVLAVVMISLLTQGYAYGIISSIIGGFCINYFFMVPYAAFSLSYAGYPVAMISMIAISCVVCALTTRVKNQRAEAIRREKRTKSLYELNERLNAEKTAIQLESARETIRGNILRAVSHDLRTPLTSISGAASVLLSSPEVSPQNVAMLRDIKNDADSLIIMVENLLSITRMGEDTRITKQPEAAEEVLGEVARKFRKHYPDVKISVAVPNELLIVPMDAILIEQVMTNLLENAVRHGKNTTHIALSVHQDGENAVFAVQDNGGGIPPKLLPVLFSGTLRHSDTPTGDGKRNMGLGLSVCNAIVRAHGGTMHAQNRDGGAEFIFCLPMIEKEPELQ